MTNEPSSLPVSDAALQYARLIPAPSSLFSSCIRNIKKVEASVEGQDSEALRELAFNACSFLVNVSPSLKTVLYKAAQDSREEQLAALSPLTIRPLVTLFSASEITSILALTYLYRHLRRKCDEDELQRLTKKMLTHMEVGAIVGKTIKHIGVGNGLLLGGLRFSAHALFSISDLKRYQEMRRKLDKADRLFDSAVEREAFGCSSLQVASSLASSFGFGLTTCLGLGLEDENLDSSSLAPEVAEIVLCWRVACLLTQSFHETGAAPKCDDSSELYLPPEEAAVLERQCWSVLRDGPHSTWLTCTRGDLPDDVKLALDIKERGPAVEGIEDLEEGEDANL